MRTRRALLGAVAAGPIALSGCVGSFLGDSCPDGDVGTVEGQWPAHGGNPGHTRSTDASGFGAEPSLRWCDDLEGRPFSLLLSDRTLYEYVREGGLNDRTYFLQAHDPSDGEQLWRREIDDEPIGGIAAEGDGVFLTEDGEDDDPDRLYRYVGADGARDWTVDLPEETDSPPAVADGSAYVVDVVGGVHAYDAASGDPEWSTDVADTVVGGLGNLPAVVDGTVYVSSAIGEGPAALAADDGAVLWQRDLEGFQDPVSNGDVVVGRGDDELTGVDAATGETRWTVDAPGLRFEAMDDDALYCFRGGDLAAYDLGDGSELWVSRPPDPVEPPFSFVATDEALLLSGDEALAAVDPESGSGLWGTEIEVGIAEVALGEGVLFTAHDDIAGFAF